MQRNLQRPLTAKEFIIESLFSRTIRTGTMTDDEEPTLLQPLSAPGASPSARPNAFGRAVHVTHLQTPPPLSILSPPTLVDSPAAICKRQRREALLELLGQSGTTPKPAVAGGARADSKGPPLFAGEPVTIRVKGAPAVETKDVQRGKKSAPPKGQDQPRTPPPIVMRPERTKRGSTLVWSIAFVTFGLSVGLGAGLVVTGRAQPLFARAKGYVQTQPAAPAPPAAVVAGNAGDSPGTGVGTAQPAQALPPTIAAALTPTNHPNPPDVTPASPVAVQTQIAPALPSPATPSTDTKAAPVSSGHHHRHASTAVGQAQTQPKVDDQDPLDDPTPPPPPKVTPQRTAAPPETVAAKPPPPPPAPKPPVNVTDLAKEQLGNALP